ncbi:MAG: N-acetyl-gamma-glutamyl-phosphate reductase [Acidobacteria bacterium]|nr:N-acetyl-gamma-glutamyl-phosphate reductase [Acidobacteriota bacterium]MYJ04663.1 N-acetyl-gamma-glutamyl-phosphate reductase [Acidobacteriota bacterium]
MATIRIGIAGATGYGGQELLRLAARHSHVTVTAAMRSGEGTAELPGLAGIWDGEIEPFSLDALADRTEVVFLGLPDTASAELAPALLERGRRVFDLSGAFRLRNEADRQRWYPRSPALAQAATYGLTEWNRHTLPSADLVACPGCYPTGALLALKPLAEAGLIADDADIYIDAKSGVSGAGKKPTERTHFSEVHGSVAAYGIFAHRHGAEIEQELKRPVTFVPHLVPLDRGILETIYTRLPGGTTARDIDNTLASAYADAPFVRLTGARPPEIKHVAHTNFCDIGWRVDGGRLVLVCCLDNLVKGAAGQALQSFNVAFGIDEREGLA